MNSLDINMEFFIIPKFKKTFQRSQIQCEGILSACELRETEVESSVSFIIKRSFSYLSKEKSLKDSVTSYVETEDISAESILSGCLKSGERGQV